MPSIGQIMPIFFYLIMKIIYLESLNCKFKKPEIKSDVRMEKTAISDASRSSFANADINIP